MLPPPVQLKTLTGKWTHRPSVTKFKLCVTKNPSVFDTSLEGIQPEHTQIKNLLQLTHSLCRICWPLTHPYAREASWNWFEEQWLVNWKRSRLTIRRYLYGRRILNHHQFGPFFCINNESYANSWHYWFIFNLFYLLFISCIQCAAHVGEINDYKYSRKIYVQ